jgi:hypothetical protein
MSNTIAWWSGGITSAVACRIALEKYENVRVVFIETGSHHPDTQRFKSDCERWYGTKIETLQTNKYSDHFDVILSSRFINGPYGARCTTDLKKAVRIAFERQNEIAHQVWGYEFTPKEINRAIRTQEQYPNTNPLFPLIEAKLNKNECAGIVIGAGIELPQMYKLGFHNNNCVGCVKGGAGYWNKIRKIFPDIFQKMAEIEREIDATCLKDKNGDKLFLDQLDPNAGKPQDLVTNECGIFCSVNFADIMHPRVSDVLNGKSIYENQK